MAEFELVIEAGKAERRYWRDLWSYRELFLLLSWRDIAVRYKQAFFGLAWAVFRPLLTVGVFTFVFGRMAGLSSNGAPYSVFVLAAMLFWQFFSGGLTQVTGSLVTNAGMISKVYFPRILIPASSLAMSMLDFLIGGCVLLALMLTFGTPITWRLLGLLPLLLLCAALSLGLGLWTSALNVRYRDFNHLVPFLLQAWMYASPVGYGSAVVPLRWQALFFCNPMVGLLEGGRWCVLGQAPPWLPQALALSLAFTALVLTSGLAYFRHTERSFADVI
jgi:lipopolysaccharide transport system permease protein